MPEPKKEYQIKNNRLWYRNSPTMNWRQDKGEIAELVNSLLTLSPEERELVLMHFI